MVKLGSSLYGYVGNQTLEAPLLEHGVDTHRDGYVETFLPLIEEVSDLYSRVLDVLGTRTSLTSGSFEETTLNRWYQPTVDWVLRYGHWGSVAFTMPLLLVRRTEIPVNQHTTQLQSAGLGWLYAYEYPKDCVKFLGIGDYTGKLNNSFTFEIQMLQLPGPSREYIKCVCTDKADAVGFYILRGPNGFWDPMLKEAIIAKLAANCAVALTGSKEFGMQLDKQAHQYIQEANAQSGNEENQRYTHTPPWVTARSQGY